MLGAGVLVGGSCFACYLSFIVIWALLGVCYLVMRLQQKCGGFGCSFIIAMHQGLLQMTLTGFSSWFL